MRKLILIGYTNRSARTTVSNNGGDGLQEQITVATDNAQAQHALHLEPRETRYLNLGESAVAADVVEVIDRRYPKAASIQAAIRWLREGAGASGITYPPEMLPPPDEDCEGVDVIVVDNKH